MATHSSTLAWEIPWTEKPGRLTVHGVAMSQTQLSDRAYMHTYKDYTHIHHTYIDAIGTQSTSYS